LKLAHSFEPISRHLVLEPARFIKIDDGTLVKRFISTLTHHKGICPRLMGLSSIAPPGDVLVARFSRRHSVPRIELVAGGQGSPQALGHQKTNTGQTVDFGSARVRKGTIWTTEKKTP